MGKHWEGGAGQRARSMMDARDRRKHAGSAKTVSARDTRVGSAKARAAAEAERGGATKIFQRYHGAHIETVTVKGARRTVVKEEPGAQ